MTSSKTQIHTVGVFIPTSGAAGIWGPSCRASAELAGAEMNDRCSGNRQFRLRFVDAGGNPDTVARKATRLIAAGAIDSIVGMHTSDVRDTVVAAVAHRIPYIYTPLHEGRAANGAHCIGATPDRQLLPALEWLSSRYRLRRWYFVGNDYVWPRVTHALAARALKQQGHHVIGNDFFGFDPGATDANRFGRTLDCIKERRPDIVLLSLIGQDSVLFNRDFNAAGLSQRVLRLSCAIEENMLLAIGSEATDGLFVSAGYFGALDTRRNGAFRERYYGRFGERAPVLNNLGQSIYEGMGRLATHIAGQDCMGVRAEAGPSTLPVYLAETHGFDFHIVQKLA